MEVVVGNCLIFRVTSDVDHLALSLANRGREQVNGEMGEVDSLLGIGGGRLEGHQSGINLQPRDSVQHVDGLDDLSVSLMDDSRENLGAPGGSRFGVAHDEDVVRAEFCSREGSNVVGINDSSRPDEAIPVNSVRNGGHVLLLELIGGISGEIGELRCKLGSHRD
ncbi:hypothetical protein PFISCL1PPCAC_2592, partial [Pristionchus fissidentatus]